VDVTTPSGLAAFRTRLLAYADNSLGYLKSLNAQGVTVWDLEGEQYPSATYVGDPRIATQLAPELDYLGTVDEFFRKFTSAGFKVGLTIRPQQFAFVNGQAVQTTVDDPASLLISKINYAKSRWGATIFYIDSNDPNMNPSVLQRVLQAVPDVLLIPENENTGMYAASAAYMSVRSGDTGTSAAVKQVYPNAFSVNSVMDGDASTVQQQLTTSVKGGDILLFHAWWSNPNNAVVKAIYQASIPNAVSNLSVALQVASTGLLTWDDGLSETGYRVERSSSGGAWAPLATLPAGSTSFVDQGASGASSYRVIAFNRDGEAASSFIVSTATPIVVAGLKAVAVSDTRIDVAWTSAAWADTGLVLQRSSSADFSNSVSVQLSAGSTSFSSTGLSAGTSYFYRVAAADRNGAVISTAASTSVSTLFPPPANLAGRALSTTQISLTWTSSLYAFAGYVIERSTSSTFTTGVTRLSVANNVTSFTDSDLLAGTTYYYRIRAVFVSGFESVNSIVVSVATLTSAPQVMGKRK